MPDVHFESFGASSTKNPQPSITDKAKIVLALWNRSRDNNYDVQAVVRPIMEAIGRGEVVKPGQLNGYKRSVRKAVQSNNREVIAILEAGGFSIVNNEPVQPEAAPIPLDRPAGVSSDRELDPS